MNNIINYFLAIPKYESPTALPFTKAEFYIWACCIGFNVAMVLVYFLKNVESKLVTALFERNAFDEGSAVCLNDLKLKGMLLLKLLLRDKGTLRTTILLADDDKREVDKKGKKEAIDFSKARFYISQDKLEKAESLKKGAVKWYLLPILCAISIGIAIGVNFLMPIFQNWGK